MNTHAVKTQENKSQAVANNLSKKQCNDESAFQLVDNRPEATAQRKLQQMMNNSPQVKKAAQLQAMADNRPPVQKLLQLDEEVDENQEEPASEDNFLDKDFEEDVKDIIETSGRKEVKIGTELHYIELRLMGSGLEIGVASEWTQINNIINTLLKAAGEPDSEIAGRETEIMAIFEPVKNAKAQEDRREKDYLRKQKAAWEARKGVNIKNIEAMKHVSKLRDDALQARRDWTSATLRMISACKEAVETAWEDFGDFLPAHLVPASAVFKERDFTGDVELFDYHTGESDDPIPIMWYKAPGDYPTITYMGKTYAYSDSVDIGGTHFGLADENDPAKTGFRLQKLAHNESRQGQKAFNDLFNSSGVQVGSTRAPALGEKGGYDGDHVKDLGFGGKDQADNYWPLAANINRRAFNGYNSNYIINYLDAETREGKARAIGGLIGKYFKVKGFYDGIVPDESGTVDAGTE